MSGAGGRRYGDGYTGEVYTTGMHMRMLVDALGHLCHCQGAEKHVVLVTNEILKLGREALTDKYIVEPPEERHVWEELESHADARK